MGDYQKQFICDTVKYECGAVCCKDPKKAPNLTINDIKNLSNGLKLSVQEFWLNFGSLYQFEQEDFGFLLLGLRYDLSCSFLETNKCSVYEYKPRDCNEYPSISNFHRDSYDCLTDQINITKKLDEKIEQILSREATESAKKILRDSYYIDEFPIDIEAFSVIVNNSHIYEQIPNRKKTVDSILNYIQQDNNLSEQEMQHAFTLISCEFWFLKHLDVVLANLEKQI
jgi:Fe-S-cluster containining protein